MADLRHSGDHLGSAFAWQLLAMLAMTLFATTGPAWSQATAPLGLQSPPIVGQTGDLAPLTNMPKFGAPLNGWPQRHYNATKAPCIKVIGESRAQVVNPRIFDNLLIITNECGETINLETCYYQKRGCLPVRMAGYSRKEIILGVDTHREFRYEYREEFL
ncbi:hypothetical protein ACVIIW_003635 [Bradyrhizobium sp. USDA 4449]